ncbi:type II toxin-antitoxin system RelE/ParE family toxin [Anaerovibrio lipolyticus]
MYYARTNYEIAYTIDVNKSGDIVVIIMSGTRENFYEQLKNYIRSNYKH